MSLLQFLLPRDHWLSAAAVAGVVAARLSVSPPEIPESVRT